MVIASVDADAHKALGTKYGVTGFPTLKLFTAESNGEGIPYSGGRTAKDIVDYINKAAGTRYEEKTPPKIKHQTDV